MEFVELQRLLQDVEVDHAIEASPLAALVVDVSQVLENLGMPPTQWIPQDPRTASDILGSVDVILECVKGAYDSGHSPWDYALGAFCRCHLRRWCPPSNSILFFCAIYFWELVLFVPASSGSSLLFPSITGYCIEGRQYFSCPAIVWVPVTTSRGPSPGWPHSVPGSIS
jgi:hypothetical protein